MSSKAEIMAAAQKEISVSEFFEKNRHLLGFDSPGKALLTTVKEAVDNALDACEEARTLPEIWVRVERVADDRHRVAVQDCGPGILPEKIAPIYGKLLYGSKFHRLRMSRGQQGIGISAAGMYGLLTTGKPLEAASKLSPRKPIAFCRVRINSKTNAPEILNPGGEVEHFFPADVAALGDDAPVVLRDWIDVPSGTRVAIELQAKYKRGRGSVDEYLRATALANPHATFHYLDPDGNAVDYWRSVQELPPEPIEIKPHPYGVELGKLLGMARAAAPDVTLQKFLTTEFCRVSTPLAKSICESAGLSVREKAANLGRDEVEKLFGAIAAAKIPAPPAECVVPIGEENILASLHEIADKAEFYAAATRPPAVYRGNPFQIEVGLAYGGGPASHEISREALKEALAESDSRTVRQFLTTTFEGITSEGADKLIKKANIKPRTSVKKLATFDYRKEFDALFGALQTQNLSETQNATVYRYVNRVPLQFQAGACAITQTVAQMNWRIYGLAQSRGQAPRGPITLAAHFAGVWAPYTSESKEALAAYPEIQKELQLALQAVGRKLGAFLRKKTTVAEGKKRRGIFMRYLPEIADALAEINRGAFAERLAAEEYAKEPAPAESLETRMRRRQNSEETYLKLFKVANRVTAIADLQLDENGRKIEIAPAPPEDDAAPERDVPQSEAPKDSLF